MNKIFSILFIVGLLSIGIFQYIRNVDTEINYERFNLISPGILRTPEERFENLKDYNFEPNYLEINGLRIHYLDEGPIDGDVIYLLHGEPAWSYLFRKMIPTLVDAGYRVIAPDMVGFGKSDKYIDIDDYSHQMHVDTMSELIRKLDLKDMTAHVHDWGGLVGLRVIAEEPERFSRVIASNTGLIAPGRGLINDIRGFFLGPIFKLTIWLQGPVTWEEFIGGNGFSNWIRYSRYTDNIDVGGVMQTLGTVNDEERLGYEAPYPNASYKAGAQIFPYLIPSELRKNEMAFREVLEKWNKPFLIANSDNDPVTGNNPGIAEGLKRIPTAKEIVIKGPGHFIQEEAGPEYAQLILDFIKGEAKGFEVKARVKDIKDIL
ncbi:haloalkane dehalogenase [SAR86 cluster bacterium]|jgi:haloalkane dehalogenase|nr:haloalkane dehalogenase [SAR86 cluster bacterium]